LIPKTLLLVKQIRSRTAKIDNLWTTIPILLKSRAFKAVESVRNALATAHDALVLVIAKRAFIADSYQGRWAHVGVADGALAVAFIAKATDGYASLFATHYEIAMNMC
jgi:hypothetical protein